MNINRATTTGALVLALIVSGTPALAGMVGQGGRDRQQARVAGNKSANGQGADKAQASGERRAPAANSGDARREMAAPRSAPRADSGPRTDQRQLASRQPAQQQAAPRQPDQRQFGSRQPAQQQVAPRQPDQRQFGSRQPDARQFGSQPNGSGQFEPRGTPGSQYASRLRNGGQYDRRPVDRRAYTNGRYDNRSSLSRLGMGIGLGLSILAGRPYSYRFDRGWAPSFAHRFPLMSGIRYGGMSFLIDPDDAAVYVDGQFIGIARDFGGQPVPIAAGWHQIELWAEGCEPVAFDVTVMPGQVIPYRGSLMGYR